MAKPGVEGGGRIGQVVLEARETAGQCVGAGCAERGVGPPHLAAGGARVLGRGTVQATAGHQAVARRDVPGGLGEQAVVVEQRVLAPGELVGVGEAATHHVEARAALAVLAAHQVQPGHPLHVGPP
ncbi:hypothetical protein D3C84_939140 [compost metagenome]